jgi:hypothetical protein
MESASLLLRIRENGKHSFVALVGSSLLESSTSVGIVNGVRIERTEAGPKCGSRVSPLDFSVYSQPINSGQVSFDSSTTVKHLDSRLL